MAPHWAGWLLAVGLWGLGFGAEMWWNLVPRKTVSSGGECLKSEETDQLGRGARREETLRGCPLGCAGFTLRSRPAHACDPVLTSGT